ncbi:delta endotoxin [Halteromyces radiatus]|uniref:delta endotoxin n=1 Tax=Halteromyces radiatus TaxID=101107 RepID=UPI00221E55F1|nr:delta endotoxin [Halteromyces radiatus]KAI8096339.1 delta endotoxin [Halteromyces radiatus]
MRISILVFLGWISFCFACDAPKVDEPSDMKGGLMSGFTIATAYLAGTGPVAALGVAVVGLIIDSFLSSAKSNDQSLARLANQLREEMDNKIDSAIVGTFQGQLTAVKGMLDEYKQDYGLWIENKMPVGANDKWLTPYYQNKVNNIEQHINVIMGNMDRNYLGLPMFAIMATSHLSILRDAAVIGNDHLGITKYNYRQMFTSYLNKYVALLTTVYDTKRNSLMQQNMVEKQLTFETAIITNAWDVAAKWSMLIPDNGISLDIFYTRPVYSKNTKCGLGRCKLSSAIVETSKNKDPQYRGVMKNLQYTTTTYRKYDPKFESDNPAPPVLNSFTSEYTGPAIIDATKNITVSYVSVHDNFLDSYYQYNGAAGILTCANACPGIMSTLTIGGKTLGSKVTNKCGPAYTDDIMAPPAQHGLSRILAAGQEASWFFEYRKNDNKAAFPTDREQAIRFPGEYIFDPKTTTIGELNYLLGGRTLHISTTATFQMPPRNQGFIYRVRFYVKSPINVQNCDLKKQTFQFAGFDLYECDYSGVSVTINGPADLGAIEVIQKKEQWFGESCDTDKDCYHDLRCLNYKDPNGNAGKMCAKFWTYTRLCAPTQTGRGMRDVRNFIFGNGEKKTTNCKKSNELITVPGAYPAQCCSGTARVLVESNPNIAQKWCELRCI